MLYSFYCKHCGYHFESTNKKKVREVEKSHKAPKYDLTTMQQVNKCSLWPTNNGTIARADILDTINEEN